MRKISLPSLLIVAAAFLLSSACDEQRNSPVDQAAQSDLQQSVEQIAEGLVTRVDEQTGLIWIRANDGSEHAFRYSDDTEITGADDNIEGLADKSGVRLKVWYTSSEVGNTAREIEVLSGDPETPVGKPQ
jgi:hypothetical protein